MGCQKFYKRVPGKSWKSSRLKDLLRKIYKTGDVQRYPGSGRPSLVRVPDISTVEDFVLSQDSNDTHASPREIERATGILHSSVRRVAKNDIGLRVFKKKRVQVLRPTKIFPLAAPLIRQNDLGYTSKSKKWIFDEEIVTTNTLWSLDSFQRLEKACCSL